MNSVPLASRLENKKIGDWDVIDKREKNEHDNSGAFSSCYVVENVVTGTIGFLKAFNYLYAFDATGRKGQSADILKEITSDFIYERELLEFCKENRMQRVVTALDHGEYGEPGELFSVPYLVFETADGSLKNVKALKNPSLAWKLRAFHGCLVGLQQLHNKNIAHQDIKPSNILIFGDNVSKLSDLGNATQMLNESPKWSKQECCGDMRYAPIELLYRHFSTDWDTRRYGADLFMMGGILTFLLTDINFLWIMLHNMPDEFMPVKFGGTYEQAKPHIMEAYYKALKFVEKTLPGNIKNELMEVVAQLCHPVPEERGNPKNIYSSVTQYSLQRFISKIDRLAKTIEFEK